MKFDLKKPCKNCPFSKAETRIRFACTERATEIAESAYRNGFPCHLSAVDTSDEDPEYGGYVFGAETQHCAGALGMFINDSNYGWPAIDNDEDLAEEIELRMGRSGLDLCFDSEDDFIKANRGDDRHERAE